MLLLLLLLLVVVLLLLLLLLPRGRAGCCRCISRRLLARADGGAVAQPRQLAADGRGVLWLAVGAGPSTSSTRSMCGPSGSRPASLAAAGASCCCAALVAAPAPLLKEAPKPAVFRSDGRVSQHCC
jgi:hypothetical protein